MAARKVRKVMGFDEAAVNEIAAIAQDAINREGWRELNVCTPYVARMVLMAVEEYRKRQGQ
jgi:hypothetical protein